MNTGPGQQPPRVAPREPQHESTHMRAGLVEASLERDGSVAQFFVMPRGPAVGDLLVALGFQPKKGHFVRSFLDSDDVPRIFQNFAAHIDEVIRYKNRETSTPWEQALEVAAKRLTGKVDWWLSGSAALAIRGVDSHPRDIDLIVDDAQLTGRLLNDILIEPVTRMHGWVADWFGRAFDQALIEWVADVRADKTAGPREDGPAAAVRRERVVWRGHEILCSPLDLQLAVCEARGLIGQAEAIRRFMSHLGQSSDTTRPG